MPSAGMAPHRSAGSEVGSVDALPVPAVLVEADGCIAQQLLPYPWQRACHKCVDPPEIGSTGACHRTVPEALLQKSILLSMNSRVDYRDDAEMVTIIQIDSFDNLF